MAILLNSIPKTMIKNFITTLLGVLLGLFLFAVGLIAIAILATYPKLPELNAVKNYQPKEPLVIYSADGVIIGSYGDERRSFTPIEQFPQVLKDAVIAAEDKRFYQHFGIDLAGIMRAALSNLSSGTQQGASTITQQVARNFYLTNERTLTRKFNEALLAYKIEKNLTKDQILELYFNQIYLGQRSYGFTAAAKTYFNKAVEDLTLAEAAILAGLPKAPSSFNPIVNPERAHLRQKYILNNMVDLNMITPAQRQAALNEQLVYERHHLDIDQNALYAAELARQHLYERYGEEIYTQGFQVHTTINIANQKAATVALRKALRQFDSGSSYRGAEQQFDLSKVDKNSLDDEMEKILSSTYTVENMVPAIISSINEKGIRVYMQGGKKLDIDSSKMGVARKAISNKKLGEKALKVGSMIRVTKLKNGQWTVVQQPLIQGALVSLDANSGAILALVGGYDFHNGSFNRASQAVRQPGSTFKPFIYSAALSRGMTASTMVNDAPIKIGDWEPKNSDGTYAGMMSLRSALISSRNTVSVRITQAMGVQYAREWAKRFGFKDKQLPSTVALALGTGSTTPLQMAEGYAVFANGGYKVASYIIDKIFDSKGQLRAQMQPLIAGQNAPQVIDPRNAYIMTSILRDVVQHGTAARANVLGRSDLAGKTGTTNDFKDSWFVGYTPKVVTAVYVGYDIPKSMGHRGYGSTLALPIWIDYMNFALKGIAPTTFKQPTGIVSIDGEVYLQEQQSTSNLAIDNSTDNPEAVQPIQTPADSEEPQAETHSSSNKPTEDAPPATSNTSKNKQNAIDELF